MITLLITNRVNRELTKYYYLDEVETTLNDLEAIVRCYSHYCDIALKRIDNG